MSTITDEIRGLLCNSATLAIDSSEPTDEQLDELLFNTQYALILLAKSQRGSSARKRLVERLATEMKQRDACSQVITQ